MPHPRPHWAALSAALALSSLGLPAQWQPGSGEWLPSHAGDVRVMTWNVKRGLCAGCPKASGATQWEATARIIASLQPDVLLLQETADSPGGVDTPAELEIALELLMHGGSDPFLGGTVTSYVQQYAPGYDLPYIYVSSESDGFIRNALMSRYPFRDLNGDGKATIPDIPNVAASQWVTSPGDGGIRGFLFAEIDLPDEVYRGDLVVGGSHFKAGNSASDRQRRLNASQRVAYVVDYWFQGAGGSVPDPLGAISANPAATSLLDPYTPIVLGGDWNEDESLNGRRGPAAWLSEASLAGHTDGTDRDRSDMLVDTALHPITGSRATIGSNSTKFDYIAWQDSIATLRRQFTFHSGIEPIAMPGPIANFANPAGASNLASDHRPVVADLILPKRRRDHEPRPSWGFTRPVRWAPGSREGH